MDLTQIITDFIVTGGFVSLFLITERKTAAALKNMQMIFDTLKKQHDDLQVRYDRETDKVGKLYTEIDELHNKLDATNTEAAIGKLKRCDRINCTHRVPPMTDEWNLDLMSDNQIEGVYNEPDGKN